METVSREFNELTEDVIFDILKRGVTNITNKEGSWFRASSSFGAIVSNTNLYSPSDKANQFVIKYNLEEKHYKSFVEETRLLNKLRHEYIVPCLRSN